jgi:hypothetical protein
MNKKQYIEEGWKELLEAPPTKKDIELVYRYFNHIPKEEFVKDFLNDYGITYRKH